MQFVDTLKRVLVGLDGLALPAKGHGEPILLLGVLDNLHGDCRDLGQGRCSRLSRRRVLLGLDSDTTGVREVCALSGRSRRHSRADGCGASERE